MKTLSKSCCAALLSLVLASAGVRADETKVIIIRNDQAKSIFLDLEKGYFNPDSEERPLRLPVSKSGTPGSGLDCSRSWPEATKNTEIEENTSYICIIQADVDLRLVYDLMGNDQEEGAEKQGKDEQGPFFYKQIGSLSILKRLDQETGEFKFSSPELLAYLKELLESEEPKQEPEEGPEVEIMKSTTPEYLTSVKAVSEEDSKRLYELMYNPAFCQLETNQGDEGAELTTCINGPMVCTKKDNRGQLSHDCSFTGRLLVTPDIL